MTAPPVEPRPAATVVLTRPGPAGLEVLLTRRPPTMAFAPDMYVFPGGRVDAGDAAPEILARAPNGAFPWEVAAIRELFEEAGVLLADGGAAPERALARDALVRDETTFSALASALDLRLRTDLLVPISRWVTPATMSRRFDARFFAAALPDDAEISVLADEVVDDVWLSPVDALEAMAEGRLGMWLPTSTTLQQLQHAGSFDDVRERMAIGMLGDIAVAEVAADVVRIEMPAGGGVPGQPVNAYLVGRSSIVLVDPGDPTGPALDRAVEEVAARGGTLTAIALTHADPDHAAGAEALREQLDVPVLVGPGGGRHLPYPTIEVHDGDVIERGDIALVVVATPGPRRDHVAFIIGEGAVVLSGDLDGCRGARSILAPPDDAALARSLDRLRVAAPDAAWLGGHPVPDD